MTLKIADKEFTSRFMIGTGKYPDFEVMQKAHRASGAQIITVAIRRVELNAPGHVGLMDYIDLDKYWILPNTAGCATVEEAVRIAHLSRAMGINNWIKLEVIPDSKYLLPDPIATLEAAKILVQEGFVVLPYINADPILAKRLEEIGCATVMPLASPIGSGQGVRNLDNIKIIIENTNIPVIVDAGLGVPSDASTVMELGADACLLNTAVALAQDPEKMAYAFKLGIEAGRASYEAGRIPIKEIASASSPLVGVVGK
ncbi:MAG TPA: thiazole synthase [Candidatus Gastranaerophilaceae bacterium]|mgnify:CR=1 FL=1|nr:thiazole synthase [Candidatus Gastranaerophilaceae bacterium]HPT42171.1 thiazole synthase [Candidatus Gastranaerophilaceae bacterium]